eukprot:symbB.v1.2.005511.t1/scaffold310.1/size231343/16
MGADGRIYLRLADGRGWAFDDSTLFPHDPSVIRGYWQPVSVAPTQGGAGTTVSGAGIAGVMGSLGAPPPAMAEGMSPWG